MSLIPESDFLLNTTPRTKQIIHEKAEMKALKKIDEYKLTKNKGCCILGIAGSGKSILEDRCANPRIIFRSFHAPHPSKIPLNCTYTKKCKKKNSKFYNIYIFEKQIFI